MYIKNDKGKRIVTHYGFHQYRITISEDRKSIMVENLTVLDSCAEGIHALGPYPRELAQAGQWEDLLEYLIERNYIE